MTVVMVVSTKKSANIGAGTPSHACRQNSIASARKLNQIVAASVMALRSSHMMPSDSSIAGQRRCPWLVPKKLPFGRCQAPRRNETCGRDLWRQYQCKE
jgi:hypothetical protein